MFKKVFFAFTAMCMLGYLMSCNKTNSSDQEKEEEKQEIIYPVDFKFIGFSKVGWYGEPTSVSYIKANDGSVIKDYFFQSNKKRLPKDPMSAIQVKDKLYILCDDYWGESIIEIVDPNSMKHIDSINVGKSISPKYMQNIDDENIIVVGKSRESESSVLIINNKNIREVNVGFNASYCTVVGKKIFVGGIKTQKDGEYINSKLAVFDIDNTGKNQIRIINDKINLMISDNNMLVDKNNLLWVAAENKIYVFDTKTEQLVKEVSMPNGISTLKTFGMSISNDKSTIYIRSHKAFYTFDVENPVTQKEPIFEIRDVVTYINDLRTTKEGNLLTIVEHNGYPSSSAEMLEINIKDNNNWKIINRYDLALSCKFIYVAKY